VSRCFLCILANQAILLAKFVSWLEDASSLMPLLA
jgi:hypothetical protein